MVLLELFGCATYHQVRKRYSHCNHTYLLNQIPTADDNSSVSIVWIVKFVIK
jgi:hypothetical protein